MNSFHTVEDIVIDPSFRRWILHQDAEARAQWNAYLTIYPEKRALVEKAKLFLEELSSVNYQLSDQDMAVLWHQIERKSDQPVPPVAPKARPRERKLQWYYLAAAVSAILITVAFWQPDTQHITSTYHTNYGETQEVILPDGSMVTLNANSSLYFDSEQYNNVREVWMQGEAYFKVSKLVSNKGETAKFIVHTDDLEVEVLGTQFNVNTRRTATKVVLTEGKVKLNMIQRGGGQPVTILPGEMVTYTPAQKDVKRENVNLNVYTAWKQQELIFEDTPVQEIIELLEDNYGLKIRLQNKEAAIRHYTGTFKNPEPDIILMALTALFNLEMEHQNNVITLK
jgi:transmembrane sensor